MASDGPGWRRLGSDPPSLGATARQAPPPLKLWRAGGLWLGAAARQRQPDQDSGLKSLKAFIRLFFRPMRGLSGFLLWITRDWSGLLWIAPDRSEGLKSLKALMGFYGFLWVLMGFSFWAKKFAFPGPSFAKASARLAGPVRVRQVCETEERGDDLKI